GLGGRVEGPGWAPPLAPNCFTRRPSGQFRPAPWRHPERPPGGFIVSGDGVSARGGRSPRAGSLRKQPVVLVCRKCHSGLPHGGGPFPRGVSHVEWVFLRRAVGHESVRRTVGAPTLQALRGGAGGQVGPGHVHTAGRRG